MKKRTVMHQLLTKALVEHFGDVLTPEFLAERSGYALEAMRLEVDQWPQACLEEAQQAFAEFFAAEQPEAPRTKKAKKTTDEERAQKRRYASVRRAANRQAAGRERPGDAALLRENPDVAQRLLQRYGLDLPTEEKE